MKSIDQKTFPIGYHKYHKNQLFNFTMNRWNSICYARHEDMLEAGKNIKTNEDWKPEMVRLAEKGRTIGQYFSKEIAKPLSIDFYIGLPCDFDADRLATLQMFSPPMVLFNLHKLPKGLWKQTLNPFSLLWKSMLSTKCDISKPIEELKFEEVSGVGLAKHEPWLKCIVFLQ